MTALFRRLLSAGILMTIGSVICAMYFSGRIQSYLVPTFQSFTIVCGMLLVLLAFLVLTAPAGVDDSHGTARKPWKMISIAIFLTAPVLIALAASKDSFSASTVLNRNYIQSATQLPTTVAPSSAQTSTTDTSAPAISDGENDTQPEVVRNSRGDIKAEVIDLLYAAQLTDMRSTFEDKSVEVIGQLMPAKENNPHGDRYDLMRMLMTCCAADVQPIALPVHPGKKPAWPEMTWVKVTGKATFPVIGGQRHALLENATIEKTDPPQDTYLY